MKGWKFKDYLASAIGMFLVGYLLFSLVRIAVRPHIDIDESAAVKSTIQEIIEEFLEENHLEVDEVTLWEIVDDCYNGNHYVNNETVGFFVKDDYLKTIKIMIKNLHNKNNSLSLLCQSSSGADVNCPHKHSR